MLKQTLCETRLDVVLSILESGSKGFDLPTVAEACHELQGYALHMATVEKQEPPAPVDLSAAAAAALLRRLAEADQSAPIPWLLVYHVLGKIAIHVLSR